MNGDKNTTNAVEIMHRRYIKDQPERKATLQGERINAQVAQLIYDLRKEAGLSQKQLADLVSTTQSVVSRLEDSDYEGHSLSMLAKITKVLNKQVKIDTVEVNWEAISVRHAFQLLMKLLRKKAGLTVEQLANKLEVEPYSVIELEQNISQLPLPIMIFKLSKFYKIPQIKLNVLAGAMKEIPSDLQSQASQFAAQSESFAKLTKEEKKLLDEFVKFLRKESR